jgi:hypothetical protein
MSGKRPFANTPAFYSALGWFYAVWSQTELAIDCAIWKASGTETAERAHERAARTKFSDKCKHLRTLLDGGRIPHGEKVKDLLTQIETHSMRNVFAHSFLATDEHSVTFIHRKVKHGKYQATTYQISRDGFLDHVQNFVQLCLWRCRPAARGWRPGPRQPDRHRLPAVYPGRVDAAIGGLISYGPDQVDQNRRAAGYVDRILNGEKPADLPVQAPTKYELVINLKTAKTLGLDVAPTLLARADEVIE